MGMGHTSFDDLGTINNALKAESASYRSHGSLHSDTEYSFNPPESESGPMTMKEYEEKREKLEERASNARWVLVLGGAAIVFFCCILCGLIPILSWLFITVTIILLIIIALGFKFTGDNLESDIKLLKSKYRSSQLKTENKKVKAAAPKNKPAGSALPKEAVRSPEDKTVCHAGADTEGKTKTESAADGSEAQKSMNEKQKAVIENLKAGVENQLILIEEQQAETENRKNLIDNQKILISDQNERIEKQKAVIVNLKAEIENQLILIEEQQAEIENLKTRIEDQRELIKKLTDAAEKPADAAQR